MDQIILRENGYNIEDRKLILTHMEIKDISEINGLENLTDLEELDLSNNRITDINGLDKLINLKKLIISENQAYEIEGLDQLSQLEELQLNGNRIFKINGLENLTNLRELNLKNNQIQEIKGLESLTNLEVLDLSDNAHYSRGYRLGHHHFMSQYHMHSKARKSKIRGIEEIKGLDQLIKLKELSLNGNDITEIKGLDKLVNLIRLNLRKNSIKMIKGLENNKELVELNLSKNDISLIQGLEDLTNLRCLDISHNEIKEIENLEDLVNLTLLDLHYNYEITEIKGLDSLKDLRELYLHDNWKIEENKGLDSLQNLEKLNLSGCGINDFKGLKAFNELRELNLSGCGINEINWLESFPNLLKLDLSRNIISDIKGLENLVNLKELKLFNNSITEIKGLESLSNLKILDLDLNEISDSKGLENLKNLRKLYLQWDLLPKSQLDKLKNHLEKSGGKLVKSIRSKGKYRTLVKNHKLKLTGGRKLEGLEEVDEIFDLTFSGIKSLNASIRNVFGKLKKLKKLKITSGQFSDISSLEAFPDLEILIITDPYYYEDGGPWGDAWDREYYPPISVIRGLETLVKLRELDLSGHIIKEIKGLETLKNLKRLNLSANKIQTIKNLENHPELINLNLSGNDISQIKGLETLTQLESLNLSTNPISRIIGLQNLTELRKLDLRGTKISKIEGLENLKKLKELRLDGSEIKRLYSTGPFKEKFCIYGLTNQKKLSRLDLDVLRVFKINEYIETRLINGKTEIFIADKYIRQCKYLKLNISTEKIRTFDEIESVDDATEKSSNSKQKEDVREKISPDEEFWAHCSNLQVWAEHNYNTRLLSKNIAFPLLQKLSEVGDPIAQKEFRNEIIKRFSEGNNSVKSYLATSKYIGILDKTEILSLIEEFEDTLEIFLGSAPKLTELALYAISEKNINRKMLKTEIENGERDLSNQFESETKKKAIWQGKITENYLNWRIERAQLQKIKEIVEGLPLNKRVNKIYSIGINLVREQKANKDIGIKILELALDYPDCSRSVLLQLAKEYDSSDAWNKAMNIYEKLLLLDPKPNYLTGLFYNAIKMERQDIVDKFLDFSLKNERFLENPNSLSNILMALNMKETKEASKIALKLTKNFWNIIKDQRYKKRLPSLWANVTWTYVVADEMDETFEEIVKDYLSKHQKDMSLYIYENIAWFFLKKEQTDKCIHYLKEGKKKKAPNYSAKYFKELKDHAEYYKLFD